jgi:CRISPR-associated protein Cas1
MTQEDTNRPLDRPLDASQSLSMEQDNVPAYCPPKRVVTPSLQEIAGAAERLARRDRKLGQIDWLHEADILADRLQRRPFRARPVRLFVPSGSDGRLLLMPDVNDRLLQEALFPHLVHTTERLLLPTVHGYRPGRSARTAAQAVSDALREGYDHLLMTDIAAFFPSVDLRILGLRLADYFRPELVETLLALCRPPVAGRVPEGFRLTGLPLGQPLSPLLSNLYLSPVDEAMQDEHWVTIRYADDLVLLARQAEWLEAAWSRLNGALADVGLRPSEEKTQRLRFGGRPVLYLGFTVDEKRVYERLKRPASAKGAPAAGQPPDERMPPPARNQTLYITTPGVYLRLDRGTIQVKAGNEILREVPVHRVDRVMILAGVSMSSGFIGACITEGIPVLIVVGKGRGYGAIVSGALPNPLRLRAQYQLSSDPERRLALARAIVDAKIDAMIKRLKNVKEAAAIRAELRAIRPRAGRAQTIESLMGHEGMATKAYYRGLGMRLKNVDFSFTKRVRRPPRDPVNSLMSFIYTLLFSEMETCLLAAGLDPHPGLLHALHRNHPALASDLIEPYRVLIGDSLVVGLINNRRVRKEGFAVRKGGAVHMDDETRRVVLSAYEEYLGQRLDEPQSAGCFSRRHLLQLAAQSMLRVVLGETDRLVLPDGSRSATAGAALPYGDSEVEEVPWDSSDATS